LELHKQNLSTRQIAEKLGISKSTVDRYIKSAAKASKKGCESKARWQTS
jgi:IS30 family transposase